MAQFKTKPRKRTKKESPEARRIIFRAISRVGDLWNLSDPKLAELLHVEKSTVSLWRRKGQVSEAGERAGGIRIVLALHESLSLMFGAPADQIVWLTTPHPSFAQAPLDVATESIEGLLRVCHYVDCVRERGA